MRSCALTLLSKVSPLCPISFPQAPFEVTSAKQALLRVFHLSSLAHLSLNETNSTLEVPGLFDCLQEESRRAGLGFGSEELDETNPTQCVCSWCSSVVCAETAQTPCFPQTEHREDTQTFEILLKIIEAEGDRDLVPPS